MIAVETSPMTTLTATMTTCMRFRAVIFAQRHGAGSIVRCAYPRYW